MPRKVLSQSLVTYFNKQGKAVEPNRVNRYKPQNLTLGIARSKGRGWRYYNLGLKLTSANLNTLTRRIDWHISDLRKSFERVNPHDLQRYRVAFFNPNTERHIEKPARSQNVLIGFLDNQTDTYWLPTNSSGNKQKPVRWSASLSKRLDSWLEDALTEHVLFYERVGGYYGEADTSIQCAPVIIDVMAGTVKRIGPYWKYKDVEILQQIASNNILTPQRKRKRFVLTPKDTEGRTVAQCMSQLIFNAPHTETIVCRFSAVIRTEDGPIVSGPHSYVLPARTDREAVSRNIGISRRKRNGMREPKFPNNTSKQDIEALNLWQVRLPDNDTTVPALVRPHEIADRAEELKWKMAHVIVHGFWNQGYTYTRIHTLMEFWEENESNPEWEDGFTEALSDELTIDIQLDYV